MPCCPWDCVDMHMKALIAAPQQQRSLQCSCYVPAVYARDGGLPPNLSKATVRITVGDENDHAPHLESESCSVEVPENQSRVALYTLRATDPDGGENGRLEYRLAGEATRAMRLLLAAAPTCLHHPWHFLFHFGSLLLQTTCSCCHFSTLQFLCPE